jgi:NNMT/PNMT/TEMT family protein
VTQPSQDTAVLPQRNEEFPWDSFDSEWYLQHNYGHGLRDDDRKILERIADFFSGAAQQQLRHGLDVGTGTNLYPVLAMLPLCHRITLHERARTNCRWLENETAKYSKVWDPYWDVLSTRPPHAPIRDPRWALHERVEVQKGSIFELPVNMYDIGTMFFVAESITERVDEFMRALRCFLRSLKPNAPFAAAFMTNSRGYDVNGVHFPAVAITEADVRKCLHGEGIKKAAAVDPIESANPLREGVGMILVTGRVARR